VPEEFAATEPDPFAWLIPAGEWFYSQAAQMFPLPEMAHANSTAAPSKYSYGDRLREVATQFARSSAYRAASAPAAPATSGQEVAEAGESAVSLAEWASFLAWIALESLPATVDKTALFDELRLRSVLAEIFSNGGVEGEDSWRAAARVRLALIPHMSLREKIRSNDFWNDGDIQWLIGISHADDTTYVDKDRFEALLPWLHAIDLARSATPDATTEHDPQYFSDLAATAGYKVKEIRRLAEKNEAEPVTST
jgi:hypothetical protein